MKFLDVVRQNDYFSLQYSPAIDINGQLHALRLKVKLYPWINSLFSFGDHVSNVDDFLLKCINNNSINTHLSNELSKIKQDLSDLKSINTLKWIILDCYFDLNSRENQIYINRLADDLNCFGISLSLFVKNKKNIRNHDEISKNLSKNIYTSHSINMCNDLESCVSLSLKNKIGPFLIHHSMFIDQTFNDLLLTVKTMNSSIIVYGINSISDLVGLKCNELTHFEGDYISISKKSSDIKKKYNGYRIGNNGFKINNEMIVGILPNHE